MSSPSAVLQRPKPRVRLAPRASESDGEDACFLASSYGLTPDDWQEDVLDDWLGRRGDGRWSAATCGLAVSRQNGKNGVIEVRELFGMIALGEKFLHTAHEVKTARKAFLRIASFFENPRQYPELAALVKEIRKTNGQEAVVLDNGGSVEFIARSKGSGRGFTVDVLVCDEAQDLTDEELAALLPTISAAPQRNPQVIFTGTPPDPAKAHQGEVFRRVRQDGQDRRDKRLAWADFGAADGPMPDVDDRAVWAEHNPTLGRRLHVGEVERERSLMDPARFAAERLGWWGDPTRATSGAIDLVQWAALKGDASPPERAVLTVQVASDRRRSCIGVIGESSGRTLLMVESKPGTGWLEDRIMDLVDKRTITEVALLPASLAGGVLMSTLPQKLAAEGVEFHSLTTTEIAQGCIALQEATKAGPTAPLAPLHVSQPELDSSVGSTRTKVRGEGETWDLSDPASAPLVAVANGLHRWRANEHGPSIYEAREMVIL